MVRAPHRQPSPRDGAAPARLLRRPTRWSDTLLPQEHPPIASMVARKLQACCKPVVSLLEASSSVSPPCRGPAPGAAKPVHPVTPRPGAPGSSPLLFRPQDRCVGYTDFARGNCPRNPPARRAWLLPEPVQCPGIPRRTPGNQAAPHPPFPAQRFLWLGCDRV